MPIKLDADIDGSHPLVPIVLSEIKKMTDLYRTTMPAGDAKSAWVSKAEIDLLVAQNAGANGIRIYYGRHAPDDTPDFKGKHNVILVATLGPSSPTVKLTSQNSADQLNQSAANGQPVSSVVVDFSGFGDDAIPLCPPNCPIPASDLS